MLAIIQVTSLEYNCKYTRNPVEPASPCRVELSFPPGLYTSVQAYTSVWVACTFVSAYKSQARKPSPERNYKRMSPPVESAIRREVYTSRFSPSPGP
jgi:hypothetical protein